MKYYLEQELESYDEPTRDCPVAKLGGITVVFVHYKSEDAREKWEERKEWIHWDNLYIISSDGNGAELEDCAKLDSVKCKRKLYLHQ